LSLQFSIRGLGGRSTRRSYRDWTLRQDGAPSPNTLAQHGGFERIRRLAQERIRERA
jgi:hypothetical protein